VIDYGEPAKVNLHAVVTDDYGVKDVSINATVAKGSGEGVRFKQQKLSFGTSFSSQELQYQLQKTIGLATLGMEPGDELYFYIMAIDNHDQEKRSDIFIVSITDTARLMSMDGLLNGVNLKPDYFRSQRQIILDAEQLLREKDTAMQKISRTEVIISVSIRNYCGCVMENFWVKKLLPMKTMLATTVSAILQILEMQP
jgi:hypothetical protein